MCGRSQEAILEGWLAVALPVGPGMHVLHWGLEGWSVVGTARLL